MYDLFMFLSIDEIKVSKINIMVNDNVFCDDYRI